MKYHPDVNTTGESHQPNNQKFREIAEAYAVLSNLDSRNAYDLLNKSNPNYIYSGIRSADAQMKANRGDDGNVKKEAYAAESYAEER